MGTDVTVVSGWGYIVYIELCQAMPGIQAGHRKTLYTAAIQLSSSVLISDFKIDTKCQLEWKSVPTFTIFPTFSEIRVDEHCASVITIRQFVGNDQCYWCLITGKLSSGRNNKQITWKQIKKKVFNLQLIVTSLPLRSLSPTCCKVFPVSDSIKSYN